MIRIPLPDHVLLSHQLIQQTALRFDRLLYGLNIADELRAILHLFQPAHLDELDVDLDNLDLVYVSEKLRQVWIYLGPMVGAFGVGASHDVTDNVTLMLLILDVDFALGASLRLAELDSRAGISLDFAAEDLDIEVNALDTILSILLDRVFKQIYCATLVFKGTALQWVLIGHGFIEACSGYHFQEV